MVLSGDAPLPSVKFDNNKNKMGLISLHLQRGGCTEEAKEWVETRVIGDDMDLAVLLTAYAPSRTTLFVQNSDSKADPSAVAEHFLLKLAALPPISAASR